MVVHKYKVKEGCFHRGRLWKVGEPITFTDKQLESVEYKSVAPCFEEDDGREPEKDIPTQGVALSTIAKAQQEEEDIILADKMGQQKPEILALRKEFEDNGFRCDRRWGEARLKHELKRALRKKGGR